MPVICRGIITTSLLRGHCPNAAFSAVKMAIPIIQSVASSQIALIEKNTSKWPYLALRLF
jgi:hypothetical protein